MINFTLLLMYTIGAAVIIISPGPDFMYVTMRGIAQGRRAGILSAAGISIGLLIHTTLAALGLSAILNTSQIAFHAIKYLGAAYLIVLGIKTIIARGNLLDIRQPAPVEHRAIFQQGVLTNVLNPKAMLTFMAFIPQFIEPHQGNPTVQVFLLGGIIALLAILWFGLVGYFAGTVGGWLSQRQMFQRIIRWGTGSVLMGLGIRLAWTKNQ